jgi:hypothetical protein
VAAGVLQSFNSALAITKSDTVNIYADSDGDATKGVPAQLTEAVYVGGAGIVVGVFQNGSTAQFTAVAGEILPIQVKRVNSATTTATLMVALRNV